MIALVTKERDLTDCPGAFHSNIGRLLYRGLIDETVLNVHLNVRTSIKTVNQVYLVEITIVSEYFE